MDVLMPNPNDEDRLETWVLLQALDFLRRSAKKGRPYVPASELREFVREFVRTDNSRDDILRILRHSKAVGQVNREGRVNKKYFLREPVGSELIRLYRKMLKGTQGE